MTCDYPICISEVGQEWMYKSILLTYLGICLSKLMLPLMKEYQTYGYQKSMFMFLVLNVAGIPALICLLLNGYLNTNILIRYQGIAECIFIVAELRVCLARIPFSALGRRERYVLMTTVTLQCIVLLVATVYAAYELSTAPQSVPSTGYYIANSIKCLLCTAHQSATWTITQRFAKTCPSPEAVHALGALCDVCVAIAVSAVVGMLYPFCGGTLVCEFPQFILAGYSIVLYGALYQAKGQHTTSTSKKLHSQVTDKKNISLKMTGTT